MAKITRKAAEKLFDRFKPYFHHVWVDEDGLMYERRGKKPPNMTETIAWLPDVIITSEHEEPYTEPIIDPVSFEEFAELVNWEVIDGTD